VLATAGNLVFQGDAHGHFTAYRADDGERLWSVATGSNITAAPVSYSVAGEQFVLVPVGAGGGIQFVYPEMHAGTETGGPTQLMAFALGGDLPVPALRAARPELPQQPELEASPEVLELGRMIYNFNCKGCHGKNAVARFGGSVPDLRYATTETHAQWSEIVLQGQRRDKGMPQFELSADEAEAVRNFVLSRSLELRNLD